jgi:phage tail-like protein
MAVKGTVRKVELKHAFTVEIDDINSANFTKMGELKQTVAIVEIWEGGSREAIKVAGRVTYDNVELTRIAGLDEELFAWAKQSYNSAKKYGLAQDEYKRDLDIVQWDSNGEELKRWTVSGAWIAEFSTGDWDNEADEGRAQVCTLAYDSFDLVED